jgi:hypothetical protein
MSISIQSCSDDHAVSAAFTEAAVPADHASALMLHSFAASGQFAI